MTIEFPAHKASLHLCHNDHKSVYQSVEDWLADNERDDGCWFEWVSPEERRKAIKDDSVWTLQWYPETPVGFCALAASDLNVLLDAASGRCADG